MFQVPGAWSFLKVMFFFLVASKRMVVGRDGGEGGGGYKPLTRHLCFNASTPDILHQSVKKTGWWIKKTWMMDLKEIVCEFVARVISWTSFFLTSFFSTGKLRTFHPERYVKTSSFLHWTTSARSKPSWTWKTNSKKTGSRKKHDFFDG